jgi:hypothetical protein
MSSVWRALLEVLNLNSTSKERQRGRHLRTEVKNYLLLKTNFEDYSLTQK